MTNVWLLDGFYRGSAYLTSEIFGISVRQSIRLSVALRYCQTIAHDIKISVRGMVET